MTDETKVSDHVCDGVAVGDGWRVYFEDGDWMAEVVPGDFLLVSHCPWCGLRLSDGTYGLTSDSLLDLLGVSRGRMNVFLIVDAEIRRAVAKHGSNAAGAPHLDLMTRFAILAEEYAELTKGVVDSQFVSFTDNTDAMKRVRGELLQLAGVSVQVLEAILEPAQ